MKAGLSLRRKSDLGLVEVGCELSQNEYFCSVLFLSFCPFIVTVHAIFLINFY